MIIEDHLLLLTCRDVIELKEAIKIKEGEAESYISEIEVTFFFVLLLIQDAGFLVVHFLAYVWRFC